MQLLLHLQRLWHTFETLTFSQPRKAHQYHHTALTIVKSLIDSLWYILKAYIQYERSNIKSQHRLPVISIWPDEHQNF